MRIRRVDWDGTDAAELVRELRAAAKKPEGLRERVAQIVADVRERGDAAVRELTGELDATERMPERLHVSADEVESALVELDTDLRRALELAATNIRAVAEAELAREPIKTRLPQGQEVSIVDRPVASAGAYAPGGRAAYPSSVLMTCIPAKVAGVDRVTLVSPPGPDGRISAAMLAAAQVAGADEVHAVGGAQAIAALAYGTESIGAVDVVVGPGNSWVTEAKRQLYGRVGIEGLAGPSELVVVADGFADPREIALDALAQAEHGSDSPVVVICADRGQLDAIEADVRALAPGRPSVADAPFAFVEAPDLDRAVHLSDCFAPEHLELRFERAGAALAAERIAGCVFVGEAGATAFGDYVVGSNHVLPTGGAARFGAPLGVRVFRRRTSVVTVPSSAADELAGAVDVIARAEGLPVHGESALARARSENADLQVD